MILLILPIAYQLVIVININVDINYQNRLLSISMQYQDCVKMKPDEIRKDENGKGVLV